jgi:hypothetical protein
MLASIQQTYNLQYCNHILECKGLFRPKTEHRAIAAELTNTTVLAANTIPTELSGDCKGTCQRHNSHCVARCRAAKLVSDMSISGSTSGCSAGTCGWCVPLTRTKGVDMSAQPSAAAKPDRLRLILSRLSCRAAKPHLNQQL